MLIFVNFPDSIVLLRNIVTTSFYPSPNHVDLKSSSLLISIPVQSQSFTSGNSMTSLLLISSTSSTTASATMRVTNSDGESLINFAVTEM